MILHRLESHLSTLKVTSLKSIATSCGIGVAGSKLELLNRLNTHFKDLVNIGTDFGSTSTLDKDRLLPKSILSFDLGYRNFAFVQLTKEYEIKEWQVTDFGFGSDHIDYHPSIIAPNIRQFLCDNVQPLFPQVDHIIVERQRARSGSSFSIFEHTLRVNTVESFLWCMLYEFNSTLTEKNNDQQQQQPFSVPMSPLLKQNIDKLWYDDLLSEWKIHALKQKRNTNNESTLTTIHSKMKLTTHEKKLASTLLVYRWLDQLYIKCPSHLKNMFYNKDKQDDLSDCLIQGVTWYQWRNNAINHLMEYV
ncbi:ribonuclease H-like domain-containing protein [Cunninghamella echinulata]|nr:ribonuclease H-like domain-containing protein [Cunninghamella echinulata]